MFWKSNMVTGGEMRKHKVILVEHGFLVILVKHKGIFDDFN